MPGAPARPEVYERRSDGWVQYWLWFDDNTQDRGVLRSGRHAGDWELVQYREDGSEAVYAQHSGAERCPGGSVESRDGRPVVYVANGSHASYFHAGTRDRMWPDPNDEADGRGAALRPRAVRVTEDSPPWMRRSRDLRPEDVTTHWGIPVTSPPHTPRPLPDTARNSHLPTQPQLT